MGEDKSARLKEHTCVVILHTVYAPFNLLNLFCYSKICCDAFTLEFKVQRFTNIHNYAYVEPQE